LSRYHVKPPKTRVDSQDKIYPPEQLLELMKVSDYIVVSTPYTPATDKLVSAEAIAAMKPSGVLINVGRGKCIDEAALIAGMKMMGSLHVPLVLYMYINSEVPKGFVCTFTHCKHRVVMFYWYTGCQYCRECSQIMLPYA
jgi:hypothetical protein